MFADRAKIIIRSGKGGDGHVSFRRELYVPNGGPDGGDGGRGGDVIFEVDEGQNTLGEYRHKHKFKAQDGQEGGKKRCHGADGDDIVLKVPEGTVIMEAQSRKVIADMSGENRRQIVLKGGRGGKGNQHYATPTMQVPKFAQPGQPAQELEVLLELKVIADVGLVGFPNVGKSTFLSRVTNAQPKIANYHFTTLSPNLGVVDTANGGFVIADIPGLIEGASEGVGLGHEFLRHIERTRVLVHIVDAASTEGRDPVDDIHKINKELEAYNPDIAARPQLIAANKIDCIFDDGEENPIDRLKAEFEPKGIKVYPISAVTGQGLKELLYGIKEPDRVYASFFSISRNFWTVFRQSVSYLNRNSSQRMNYLPKIFRLQLRDILKIRISLLWKDLRLKKCLDIPIWILKKALLSSSVS